jgi:membrane-associated phospholipid phosphatase
VGLVAATAAALHLRGFRRSAMIGEYLALSLVMAMVFTVFCYLAFASSGAMMDRPLLAIDRAMGFDWLSGFEFVSAHKWLARVLAELYDSLNIQVLYVCVFLGLIAREQALKELFWLLFVSALITNIVAIFVPAYGPFEVFGLASHGAFLPDMIKIKNGHDLTFALGKMTGVICFPSFHTVMALAYAWSVRRTGLVGYALAAINFVMLFSIPYFGGHYLIDMIAGAVTVLVALGIVKWGVKRVSQPALI